MLRGKLPYENVVINVDECFVPKEYQRELNGRDKKIVAHFDPQLFHPICVSLREHRNDVFYAIFDGQARWEAAKELKWDKLPALLYEDLRPRDEAAIFVNLQDKRTKISPYAKYRANVFRGERLALTLEEGTRKLGFEVVDKVGPSTLHDGQGEITAVKAALGLAQTGQLERGLKLLSALWGRSNKGVCGHMLRGMMVYVKSVPPESDAHALKEAAKKTIAVESVMTRAQESLKGRQSSEALRREIAKSLANVFDTELLCLKGLNAYRGAAVKGYIKGGVSKARAKK